MIQRCALALLLASLLTACAPDDRPWANALRHELMSPFCPGMTLAKCPSSQAEQLNRRMYVLSIVAAVFLPLGFLTGLLGINVAGIPGSESPWGFLIFVALLCALVGGQLWYFRKKGWF